MTSSSGAPGPPRRLERLLARSLPPGVRGASILGDVREEFAERQERDGASAARRWFLKQSVILMVTYRGGVGAERPRRPRNRGDGWMETFVRYVRLAARALVRAPGFSLAVVATLAVGIAANTVILSVLNAVMVQSMPYPDADRLVLVNETFGPERNFISASWPNFEDWRQQNRAFDEMAAFLSGRQLTLTGNDDARRLGVSYVSPSYLRLIGAEPVHGRLFTQDDNAVPNAHPLVILTHGLWQRDFGSDPAIVGSTIQLSGRAHTVVGVTQPDLVDVFSSFAVPEAWVPAMMLPQDDRPDVLTGRRFRRFSVLARVRTDNTVSQAQSEMERVTAALAEAYPDANRGMGIRVRPLRDALTANLRGPVVALLVGAVMLLVVGGINAASLFLVRANGRSRLAAVQLALGASPRHIAGEVMTESLMLAILGGGLGVLLAAGSLESLMAWSPVSLPGFAEVRVSAAVAAAAGGLILVGGLVLGAGAAWRLARTPMSAGLSTTGRTTGSAAEQRVRQALVVGEVAMALVLLVGAGLMVRSFGALRDAGFGFRTDHLLTFRVDLPTGTYASLERQRAFGDAVLRQLDGLPGVETADLWGPNALAAANFLQTVTVRGRPIGGPDEAAVARRHRVSAGAVERLGMRIVAGRDIAGSDRNDRAPVAVISEGLAATVFPEGDALGQYIRRYIPTGSPADTTVWAEVVGIASNAAHGGRVVVPGTFNPTHDVYYSWFAQPDPGVVVMLRTAQPPTTAVAAARAVVGDIDPDLAVFGIQTIEDIKALEERTSRFTAVLMSAFGGLAMVLASIGLYGVVAYSVSRRTREIGLRTALGATHGDNARMFVGRALRLTAVGLALGLVASLGLVRLVSGLLFEIGALDPVTFVGAPALLLVIAIVAAVLPTRRASRVDPVLALRHD